ncbi:RNA-binding domain-containing protein [Lichtheimia hyalospora FSU 10163]|nr:RNA-binding domain-containing protein [Lichtheimia hyalospora FSU 10163]
MSENAPSQTLYLRNLPYKINVDELRASLYALFITHGTILDIVTKKSNEMREQAFIVYDNVASATAALRSLQNANFYNKPMNIEYAKTKSNAVAMIDGTYRLPSLEKNKSSTALGKRSQADEEKENSTPTKMARQDEDSDDE